MMAQYRFMTCNIRIQTPHDGEQQFLNRVDFVCRTLLELAPDVIGFQELDHSMRLEILSRMPGYAILGAGRNPDRLGEGAPIAYRQDRLMPERLVSEMLSFAPHIPGTTYGGDQSPCPRVFSSVDFMPIDGGSPFRFMNAHTDHVGPLSRQLAATQMLQSLSTQNALRPMPTVITGDFNALPDAPEMKPFSDFPGLRDITAGLPGTFHNYERLDPPIKIDYIFLTDEWREISTQPLHLRDGMLCFSDHDPIMTTAALED